jgi:endonuclease/exonuclease/phosphatase (EEP) superfamily protein YafD
MRVILGVSLAVVVGAGLATGAGFLGGWWWGFDLLAHFRVQYVVVLAMGGGVLVALRCRVSAALAGVLVVTNAIIVWPLLFGGRAARGGTEVRVFFANVNTQAGDPARVRRAIDDAAADVVGLAEVDEAWLAALEPTLARYPYRVVAPRKDNFGVALYSTRPLEGWIASFGEDELPTAIATVAIGERRVRVLVTHPLPPISAAHTRARDAQLEWLSTLRGEGTFILLGDLNTSPYSRVFKRLCDRLQVVDTRRGFGVMATWPTQMSILSIPIDHVLVSSDVAVREFHVGPRTGSDHLPVIATLVL